MVKKVTRTEILAVLRYVKDGTTHVITLPEINLATIKAMTDAIHVDSYEWGYAPVNMEMSAEDFRNNAKTVTDLAVEKLYVKKSDVPRRADR